MKAMTVAEVLATLMHEDDGTPLYLDYGDRVVPLEHGCFMAITSERGQVERIQLRIAPWPTKAPSRAAELAQKLRNMHFSTKDLQGAADELTRQERALQPVWTPVVD